MSKKLQIKNVNKSNLQYEIPFNVQCIQWILNMNPALSIIWILIILNSYGFHRINILEVMVACGRFDFKTLLILLVVLG